MALVVEALACARGGVTVLNGVNFTLQPGHALILRGANGIGKTTLLRTIAGLQPALAGRIAMASDQVAYGAHADGIKAMLSVAENLQFWAGLHGSAPVSAAMAAFGLTDLAERPARSLSAGQKRRLGLARLMVTARALWLLDEPTVSLDSAGVEAFAAALARHLQGGGMALIATHIDLGFEAEILDLTPFRAGRHSLPPGFDEAFL